ncbi:MAG: indolepyruvate ferredoxin oxidoreductase subunit alpha, partial [Desulfobacteraceae bacterium 4572_35.2]
HSKSIVESGEPVTGLPEPSLKSDPAKFVMLPGNARQRHHVVEAELIKMAEWSATQSFNRIEERSAEVGVITGGVSYQYAREVLPDASVLKLGLVYPLPTSLIREFAAVASAITGEAIGVAHEAKIELPNRPPNMCPGCPHRGVFYTLKRLKAFVTGDIGCYTLGFMPPLSAMDTCICMGASVGNATGLNKVLTGPDKQKVVGVIGDSTFLHTGINGLMDMVYNNSTATLIILDNSITAMTGRQENPSSGFTLDGEKSKKIDLALLCRSVGVEHVRKVNPWDLDATRAVIKEEMEREAPSVVITEAPCILIKRDVGQRKTPLEIDPDKCTGCKACLKIGCPAIEWQPDEGECGKAVVNELLCVGCTICDQLCKFDAFKLAGSEVNNG